MTLPIIHASPQLSELTTQGSWDALILITDDELFGVTPELSEEVRAYRELDHAARQGVQLIPSEHAPGRRLILCALGDQTREGDDLQEISEIAAEGTRRALAAGAQRPCLHLSINAELVDGYPLETALFGALSALWVPIEAREVTRGRSVEAFGVCAEGRDDLAEPDALARWTRWVTAVEQGRFIARDITGTEPERMAPLRLAELCKRAFKGTPVKVELVRDRATLEREYPLLSAVSRASWSVERHHPCVIRLRYDAPRADARICLAGKGDVRHRRSGPQDGGHMAGMSRTRGSWRGRGLYAGGRSPRTSALELHRRDRRGEERYRADAFVTDEIVTSHAGVRVRIETPTQRSSRSRRPPLTPPRRRLRPTAHTLDERRDARRPRIQSGPPRSASIMRGASRERSSVHE